MATLTYRTAGESHGPAIIALVEGMPAGVPVDKVFIDSELRRRQGGYGRGGRQKIEVDQVQIRSGVRRGERIGWPVVVGVGKNDSGVGEARPGRPPPPGPAGVAGGATVGGERRR